MVDWAEALVPCGIERLRRTSSILPVAFTDVAGRVGRGDYFARFVSSVGTVLMKHFTIQLTNLRTGILCLRAWLHSTSNSAGVNVSRIPSPCTYSSFTLPYLLLWPLPVWRRL